MALPNIYTPETTVELTTRISSLSNETPALWGKMNAGQMLSHCCVAYQQVLGENTDKPGMIMKWMLKTFFKQSMVNEVPYRPNLPTGPTFVRLNQNFDIEAEKSKLIGYIQKIQELGPEGLSAKPSLTLGKLTAMEWNNLLYKHIDHHLRQFGV
ncbi:MAG: hypothetical protein RIS20_2234 [Bacteroidota bacterium]|jgi:hypothetical protein